MQLQGMTIALRQRMPWEATDLGIALVRAHAGRIFAAWCLVTLPVWVLINALAWQVESPWLALLAMWWLKPLFDRVPLYAISRAVFGHAPSLRAIVRAQFTWGWRAIAPWLLWRRLNPARPLLLPVDLLEGLRGGQRRERVRVLTRGDAGPRNQLVALGAEFEFVLAVAVIASVLMFVPSAFLSDATTHLLRHLFVQPPLWAKVALNGCVWFGSSLVEPFVVGAGFGLYLNRRVQLEAWDVEHAFRRIAARLSRGAQWVVLVAALALGGFASHPAVAMQAQPRPGQDAPAEAASPASSAVDKDGTVHTTLPELFGADYRAGGKDFAARIRQARAGLTRTERDWSWQPRSRKKMDQPRDAKTPEWAQALADIIALIARWWLWIVAAFVLALVAWHHKAWMGWLADTAVDELAPSPETSAIEKPVPLPDDIPSAVRALWQRGEQRAALALLYQAAVQRLSDRLGTPLPPGATEGECLTRSRRLADRRYAGLFARIVQCWQAAAYARRLPETEMVEGLLAEWTAPAAVAA